MMDIDDGYILWTGIWKGSSNTLYDKNPNSTRLYRSALGNSKGLRSSWKILPGFPDSKFLADIAKMIESQPNLAPLIRRVRGGYLKIQGTWMPYEVSGRCLLL